jgi:phage terminase small subunit
MSRLKPTHEAFCRSYAANPNATLAALEAGYAQIYAAQQGWRLLQRPRVRDRIAEMRIELAERDCATPAALLAKLETAFSAALEKNQPLAAARVVETQAKIAGMLAAGGAGSPSGADDAIAQMRHALTNMAKQLGLAVPCFEKAV